jgi:hypothetical protein
LPGYCTIAARPAPGDRAPPPATRDAWILAVPKATYFFRNIEK